MRLVVGPRGIGEHGGNGTMALFTRLGEVMGRTPTEEEVVAWVRMTIEQREALVALYVRHNEWMNGRTS